MGRELAQDFQSLLICHPALLASVISVVAVFGATQAQMVAGFAEKL